tara:strand:- start:717 stop:1031 length:315 start_codon:yes stop_codon:yes gene_type:complete
VYFAETGDLPNRRIGHVSAKNSFHNCIPYQYILSYFYSDINKILIFAARSGPLPSLKSDKNLVKLVERVHRERQASRESWFTNHENGRDAEANHEQKLDIGQEM